PEDIKETHGGKPEEILKRLAVEIHARKDLHGPWEEWRTYNQLSRQNPEFLNTFKKGERFKTGKQFIYSMFRAEETGGTVFCTF
ncbi:MAG: hypothetical protein AABX37_00810, partial [Nanoarchaeota archaeon]